MFSYPFDDYSEEDEQDDEITETCLQMLEEDLDDLYLDTLSDDRSFNVWCCCHRIQLCVKDAIDKDNDLKLLRKVIISNNFL